MATTFDITWCDVETVGSALPVVDDIMQEAILAHVNTVLNLKYFRNDASSPKLRLARIYLAAHIATEASLGAGGPLTSQRADGLAETYAAPFRGQLYMTTGYGRAFSMLIMTTAARAGTIV